MTRKILITLSLASLCFLPAWRDVLDPATNKNIYYARSDPRWTELFAVTCNILLLSALLFPVVSLALRAGRSFAVMAARVVLLGVALFTLNALRLQFDLLYFPNLSAKLGRAGAVLLALSLLAALAFATLRLGLAKLAAAVAAIYLILSPFTLVAYVQAIMMSAKYVGKLTPAASAAPARRADAGRGGRVLWLLFDEMEYRLLFAERPATLKAPEFDRLRAESLHASQAYPPPADSWRRRGPKAPASCSSSMTRAPRRLVGLRSRTSSGASPGAAGAWRSPGGITRIADSSARR
jgi:hypothetical protein